MTAEDSLCREGVGSAWRQKGTRPRAQREDETEPEKSRAPQRHCVSGPQAWPRLLRADHLSPRSLRCYSRSPQTSLLLPHRELVGRPPHAQLRGQ